MDDLQFYPTPAHLGAKICSMFERPPSRVLEPSAGNGDLVKAIRRRFRDVQCDLYEIDPARHDTLRDQGTIIGFDFLESTDLSIYSHIVMNPPFRNGVRHVLHAWQRIFSGEIVAILNASGVQHPTTVDERKLCRIISEHGRVEYAQEAFMSPDTLRKTAVEVALVYLRKTKTEEFWNGSILDGLSEDQTSFEDCREDPVSNGVALNGGQVKALVRAFNIAWEATKQSHIAEERSIMYSHFFYAEFRKIVNKSVEPAWLAPGKAVPIQERLTESYAKLKEAAWMSVLNTSDFRAYLTRKVIKEVLANFESIKKLDFTASNIYGFLQGFALKKADLNLQMVCDLFDNIVWRNSENCLFYRWKSNERHQVGMALRRRRFILSGFSAEGWRSDLGWEAERRLEEIDRVFALVDGKQEPENGLLWLFRNHFKELVGKKRMTSRYFDVRYHSGIGTIHFFPLDQKLLDRVNILVGKHRRWMPEDFDMTDREKDVDAAYKGAETFSDTVSGKLNRWTLRTSLDSDRTDSERDKALDDLDEAFDAAVQATGQDGNFFSGIRKLESHKENAPSESQRFLALVS